MFNPLIFILPMLCLATNDLYVWNKWGSDLNPCTAQEPCQTLTKAINLSKPNDQIWIRGGDPYPCENVKINHFLKITGFGEAQFTCNNEKIAHFLKGGDMSQFVFSSSTIITTGPLFIKNSVFMNATSSIIGKKEANLVIQDSAFMEVNSIIGGFFEDIIFKGVGIIGGFNCIKNKISVKTKIFMDSLLWSSPCPLIVNSKHIVIQNSKILNGTLELSNVTKLSLMNLSI